MAEYIHNKEQNGIEVYFAGKPDSDILDLLKANKWRWNPKKSCWYNKYSKENEEFAEEISNLKSSNNEHSLLDELSDELDEMLQKHSVLKNIDVPVMGGIHPISKVREKQPEKIEVPTRGKVTIPVKGGLLPPVQKDLDLKPVVDDRLLEIVLKVIRDCGIEVLRSRVKAPSIFSDLLVSFGKEKHIVRMALREGMVAKLLSVATESASMQRSTLVAAVEYMHEELGMDYKASCAVLMTFQAAINKSSPNVRGKSTCHQLKEMRRRFAEANGIEFFEDECTYDGPCDGTCPYCDSKTKELAEKAKRKGTVQYPSVEIKKDSGKVESDDDISCGTVPTLIADGQIDGDEFTMGDLDFIDEELPFN